MQATQTATQATTSDVFHAVADPTRRQLLDRLTNGESAVMPLCAPFAMSRTAVSKHLHVLLAAGLVSERRVGRETLYSLDPTPLDGLKYWLNGHALPENGRPALRKVPLVSANFQTMKRQQPLNWGED